MYSMHQELATSLLAFLEMGDFTRSDVVLCSSRSIANTLPSVKYEPKQWFVLVVLNTMHPQRT